MSLQRLKSPRVRLAVAAAVVCLDVMLLPTETQSCGGGFGEITVIDSRDTLLSMPSARFGQEISRIKLPATPFKCADPDSDQKVDLNAKAELEDLTTVLTAQGIDAEQMQALKESAFALRRNLMVYTKRWNDARFKNSAAGQKPSIELDERLPVEFREYLAGWAAYQLHEPLDQVQAHWQKVLALRAEQRQWRGVWAAYMLGRSSQTSDPNAAVQYFETTRQLAAAGAHDTLALAASSFGWQARVELDRKDFKAAIDLYLQHSATGDGTAIASLQMTCSAAIEAGNNALASLATHENSRAVMTSYILAMGGPWQTAPSGDRATAWLNAIEAAKIAKIDNADRLAWLAYQYGRYDLAARWVARADPQSGIAQWVSSKLAMQNGNVDEALKLLAQAAKSFPTDVWSNDSNDDDTSESRNVNPARRISGELGALLLARSKYVESLDLLVRNGYGYDCAYIAERVLTVDELKKYIDQSKPSPSTRPADSQEPASLNSLLARRLLRLGRWKDARPYFGQREQARLDQYITAIRDAHDSRRPAIERGRSFWQAARIARDNGMELLGTELGPDGAICSGSFEASDYGKTRIQQEYAPLKPSADEMQRLQRPPEQVDRRFHYRYIAADHAWAAAELLPDNSAELANILNTAGNWLKARDPQSADRFYKALVRRCPNTEIGKNAIDNGWLVSAP